MAGKVGVAGDDPGRDGRQGYVRSVRCDMGIPPGWSASPKEARRQQKTSRNAAVAVRNDKQNVIILLQLQC